VTFYAAHHLSGLRPDHKCTRVHGHTYVATVVVEARLLDDGFLIDAGLIESVIKEAYDHQDLNEVMSENPTAENLARAIMQLVDDLILRLGEQENVSCIRVILEETPTMKVMVSK